MLAAGNTAAVDPAWPTAALHGTAAGVVWLERPQAAEATDAIVLERLAGGAGIVLDRTRGRAPAFDPASVETLLAADAAPEARLHAARRIALPDDLLVRVVATLPADLTGEAPQARWSTRLGRVSAAIVPAGKGLEVAGRSGTGPAVVAAELPRSWAGAIAALRLTADGTPDNPGPRQLCHDDLGALAAVAAQLAPAAALVDDVLALRAAQTATAGSLAVLAACVEHTSLRRTAAALHVHHSTLQARLPRLQAALGYAFDTPTGRLRLHLALALHRIHRSGELP